jgi:hypothetical protein
MFAIKLAELSKEAIGLIPKTINSNGCWIPITKSANSNGYIQVTWNGKYHNLHRIVVCIYYNRDYDDKSFLALHSKDCSKSCFFHEHLRTGTEGDNIRDSVLHGTHKETRKLVCPKCKGEYRRRKRTRYGVECWIRYCVNCYNEQRKTLLKKLL